MISINGRLFGMPPQSGKNSSRIFYELSSHFGLPESKLFPKILKKLLTQKEAKILLCLPGTSEEVAKKTRIQVTKVTEILEDLFIRGIVIPTSTEGEVTVYALGGNVYDGYIYELGAKKARGERLSATEKELLVLTENWSNAEIIENLPETPEMRVLPVNKAIPLGIEVLPYEKVSSILEKAELISVAACPCRTMRSETHAKCPYPLETCIQLDQAAEIMLKRGVARRLTTKEALELLKQFDDVGLVPQVANANHGFQFICNCCSCCCDYLRGLILLGKKNATAKSRYHAVVEEALCTGCGVCETRCHFGAIKIKDGIAHSDPDKCFGCGLCVSKCPTEAISLVLDKEKEHIPAKKGWPLLPALPPHDVLLKTLEEKDLSQIAGQFGDFWVAGQADESTTKKQKTKNKND